MLWSCSAAKACCASERCRRSWAPRRSMRAIATRWLASWSTPGRVGASRGSQAAGWCDRARAARGPAGGRRARRGHWRERTSPAHRARARVGRPARPLRTDRVAVTIAMAGVPRARAPKAQIVVAVRRSVRVAVRRAHPGRIGVVPAPTTVDAKCPGHANATSAPRGPFREAAETRRERRPRASLRRVGPHPHALPPPRGLALPSSCERPCAAAIPCRAYGTVGCAGWERSGAQSRASPAPQSVGPPATRRRGARGCGAREDPGKQGL